MVKELEKERERTHSSMHSGSLLVNAAFDLHLMLDVLVAKYVAFIPGAATVMLSKVAASFPFDFSNNWVGGPTSLRLIFSVTGTPIFSVLQKPSLSMCIQPL